MPHESRNIGGYVVTPLCDAVGVMGPALRRPLAEIFPGSGLADEPWILHFHCFLLQGARTIVVDTGIGVDEALADLWPLPGKLESELAAVGLRAADVDTVIITHLHSDHVGGAPLFPGAEQVVQRAELDWATPRALGLLGDVHAVEGEYEVAPGVRVHHTPGHTPGHQIVRVGELTLSGDLFQHPVQLSDPAQPYLYDDDPVIAAATRETLLRRLRAEGALLGTGHLADPFVRIARGQDGGDEGQRA